MKQLTSFFLSIVSVATLFCSCQSEPNAPHAQEATGCITLNMQDEVPFVEVGTRASQSLTDFNGYVFLLNGTDTEGHTVTDKKVEFGADNRCIIPAGTYTLSANNKETAVSGNGAPYHRGTSSSFTLKAGGSESVSIDLGKPQNTMVTLTVDPSFSALYSLTEVTIADATDRTLSLKDEGTAYLMIPEGGIITYTIKATALASSHVEDLPTEGVKGTLKVEAGKAYPITLTAKAITDLMIGIGEGEHNGAFNAPRKE